jgi:sporulation protein YlmC with PRC-barrel domain
VLYLPVNNRGKQVGDVNENYVIVDGHKVVLLLVLGVERKRGHRCREKLKI